MRPVTGSRTIGRQGRHPGAERRPDRPVAGAVDHPRRETGDGPCKLAQKFWGGTGTCTIVDVGGKKVGVVTTNGRGSYDQWAAYRHDDGTVVYFAQAKKSDNPGRSPLTQPVFTTRQLAELVTSTKFKIST